jgi:competence protein ComEA
MFSKPFARFPTTCLFLCLASILFALPACSSSKRVGITLTTRVSAFTGNIYISGAVNNPGLYSFKLDDSLDELVRAAGGLKTGAELSQASLVIPDTVGEQTPQRIDINRAEAWLLSALPGIGEVSAHNIIEYREMSGPFRSTTDLLKVKGIGQATLEKIKDLITVG